LSWRDVCRWRTKSVYCRAWQNAAQKLAAISGLAN
jgi:hypothetical protein